MNCTLPMQWESLPWQWIANVTTGIRITLIRRTGHKPQQQLPPSVYKIPCLGSSACSSHRRRNSSSSARSVIWFDFILKRTTNSSHRAIYICRHEAHNTQEGTQFRQMGRYLLETLPMSGWFPTGIYQSVPTGSVEWTTKDSTGRSEKSKKLKWKEVVIDRCSFSTWTSSRQHLL